MVSKLPSTRRLLAEVVLRDLHAEARYERALARHQHYRNQFHDRIAELQLRLANLQKQIDGGRLDLEPMAGITRREIRELQDLMSAEVVA